MVKLTALYRKPQNVEEFDRYYRDVHMPLARKMPKLRRIELGKVTGSPNGEPPYHLIADLYFDNSADLREAMASPEGKATARDLGNFAQGIVSVVVSTVEEIK